MPVDGERTEVSQQVDALHALLDAQMDALKERLIDLQHAIERIPIEQRAAVETAMVAAAKATDAALLAAKAAVEQAAIAHAREHVLMATALERSEARYLADKNLANEWRGTVTDIAAGKMDTQQVRGLFDAVDTRLKSMEQELATTRGAAASQKNAIQGQMWLFGAGVGVLSLLIGVVSVWFSHVGK